MTLIIQTVAVSIVLFYSFIGIASPRSAGNSQHELGGSSSAYGTDENKSSSMYIPSIAKYNPTSSPAYQRGGSSSDY